MSLWQPDDLVAPAANKTIAREKHWTYLTLCNSAYTLQTPPPLLPRRSYCVQNTPAVLAAVWGRPLTHPPPPECTPQCKANHADTRHPLLSYFLFFYIQTVPHTGLKKFGGDEKL